MKSILIFIVLFISISPLQFSTIIQQRSQFCFSQYVMQSTPFHIQTNSSHQMYSLKVFLKNGTRIILKEKGNPKIVNSYSAIDSQYQFCIENAGQTDNFIIKFIQGIDLYDHKTLPKRGQGKIIQQLVNYISDIHQKIKMQDEVNNNLNEYNMQLQKLVSYKAVGLGFCSIAIILIISFSIYISLKRVMRNKKLI